MEVQIFDFVEFGDETGKLVAIQSQDIPFDIKRIFYIYGSNGDAVRGQHANRKSEFILINVAGKSKVRLDDGNESRVIELDRPSMGVYIPKLMWKDMYDFSEDAVLLCIASEEYDDTEYIRDYNEYIGEMKRICKE